MRNKDNRERVKYTKEYKNKIVVGSELREIIEGVILGDATVLKRYPVSDAVIKFCQGDRNKDYIFHLYDKFEPLVATPPRQVVLKREKDYVQHMFQTLSFKFINEYRERYYDGNGKKIIPSDIEDKLTERSLVVMGVLICIFVIIYSLSEYELQGMIQRGVLCNLSLSGLNEETNNLLGIFLVGVKGFDEVNPEKSYLNADKDKKLIYDENKKKSGVYCWTNITNGKRYVGSSENLSRRISWYYSFNRINKLEVRSLICRALLKYGYSGFRLDILEYCSKEKVLEREQYYMDLMKPEYNILQVAGSSSGFKHSEETMAKLRARKPSAEQIEKLRERNIEYNARQETKAKARVRMLEINEKKGIRVEVIDTETKETRSYSSIREAARVIGCEHITILRAEKVLKEKGIDKLINERFIVK